MMSGIEEYLIELNIPNMKPVKMRLIRGQAPLTIQAIIRKLPLTTRLSKIDQQILIALPIKAMIERTVKEVRKGQVAYWHASQAMVIYLSELKLASPVVPVGEVIEGIEVLEKAKSGMGVNLKLVV